MKNLLIIILLILYGSHVNAGINYWSYQTSVDPFTDETNSYASFQTRNDEKRDSQRPGQYTLNFSSVCCNIISDTI